jgi:hypothetical protein
MRALGLAVALFAITLNFLQPLAHAAMMRDGAPQAQWSIFCNADAASPESEPGKAPITAGLHDCCLGVAHAPALAAPPPFFVAIAPITTFIAPLVAAVQATPVGIRDGPTRPRGPPSLA